MTWIHFAWGGLLGGTSALVAVILSIIFFKSFKARLISALSLCFSIFLSLFIIFSGSDLEARFYELAIPHYRIKNFMNTKMLALTHVPSVRAELQKMTLGEQKTFLQKITGAGVKRLSGEDLGLWNLIRKKLAEGDERFCSGLYTGKVDEEILWRAFEKLPRDDLMLWTQIMIEAGRREWERVGFREPPAKALGQGLEQITSALPKEESERLATVLALGNSNSDESACWAMKKILVGTEALPPSLKEDFLRSLAIQF